MYEARQNKEKVSRRIDAAGGGARQRVKFENTGRMSLHLGKVLIQKKTIKNDNLTKGIIQAVLVTDVPTTQDFSQVTDLAIWWAMAAEYHFQKNLQKATQNVNSLNPLDYIYSLSDYLPGGRSQQINVNMGDSVRMLTHGSEPDDQNRHLLYVNNRQIEANSIVDNINRNITNGQVTPLYCYMGNNPQHRHLIPGIGPGPMLSPTMGSVSLRNDMGAIRNALERFQNKTWEAIIDNMGCWIPINQVTSLNQLFRHYQNSVNQFGVNSQRTVNALKILLNQVYAVVNRPYNDFANYLINYSRRWWFQRYFHLGGLTTGKGQTLWK